jgi:hypothetical protein
MSARANAAARQRRAGEPVQQMQQPNGNGNGRQNFQQQQQHPVTTKLSISDAIALITLRLGRVEQIMQNMPVDNHVGQHDENIRIIDDTVFTSIVTRIDALEKSQRIPINAPINTNTNTVSKESFDILKAEMVQVKDLLMQLQNFTMQTNQKLSSIIFTENIGNEDYIEYTETETETEDVPFENQITLKTLVENCIVEESEKEIENNVF